MRIIVPIKQVPETGAVKMDEATGTMIREGVEAIVNPLDLYALELAIRFCADALNECYFGWDEARFASAAAHNLQRARTQFELSRRVAHHQKELQHIVAATG